jgi:hypothetical protein
MLFQFAHRIRAQHRRMPHSKSLALLTASFPWQTHRKIARSDHTLQEKDRRIRLCNLAQFNEFDPAMISHGLAARISANRQRISSRGSNLASSFPEQQEGFFMLDSRPCKVSSAEQLDTEIQDIFWLDNVKPGDEIRGTLNVYYSNESVKLASLIPTLEDRGVVIAWHKIL